MRLGADRVPIHDGNDLDDEDDGGDSLEQAKQDTISTAGLS